MSRAAAFSTVKRGDSRVLGRPCHRSVENYNSQYIMSTYMYMYIS